jgi:hypothetical protein
MDAGCTSVESGVQSDVMRAAVRPRATLTACMSPSTRYDTRQTAAAGQNQVGG